MKKHYQDIVDEVFGTRYKHRTLRTIFDENSHEWTDTPLDEKKAILKKILESKLILLEDLIVGYRNFYLFELDNKSHVLNSLTESLQTLELSHSPMIETFESTHAKEFNPEDLLKAFSYQPSLTNKLDGLSRDNNLDFTQENINQIVLWKVNRFAEFDEVVLNCLNKIDSQKTDSDEKLTKEILKLLLDKKGVGLPMASTILRFKNPRIYQIIDQRVYRVIYGETLKVPHKLDNQISLYIKYLADLKGVCSAEKMNIKFEDADRILFELDKKLNKEVSLNGY